MINLNVSCVCLHVQILRLSVKFGVDSCNLLFTIELKACAIFDEMGKHGLLAYASCVFYPRQGIFVQYTEAMFQCVPLKQEQTCQAYILTSSLQESIYYLVPFC